MPPAGLKTGMRRVDLPSHGRRQYIMVRHTRFWLLASALLMVVGCGDSDNSTGRLRIELADAPFAFDVLDSAMVTIDRVEVHIITDGGDDAEDSGWEVVSTEVRRLDLLDLTNGVTATLV